MKRLLTTWLWLLGLALALGLAIGTCVRREAERPATYIGDAPTERLDASCGLRAIASKADTLARSLRAAAASDPPGLNTRISLERGEQPTRALPRPEGDRTAARHARRGRALSAPARPGHVGLPRTPVLHAGDHEQQIREPVEIAQSQGVHIARAGE